MKLDLSAKEAAGVIRRRQAKGRQKLRGPKLVKLPSPKADRGREIDVGFRAYLRRQPCEARHMGGCEGPIEAAHVRYSDASRGAINPGMGRKNHDRHCNPLCRFHHQHDQHKRAERAFWADLGKDAYDTAAAHYAAYRSAPSERTAGTDDREDGQDGQHKMTKTSSMFPLSPPAKGGGGEGDSSSVARVDMTHRGASDTHNHSGKEDL